MDLALGVGGLRVSFSIDGIVVTLIALVDCEMTCLYVFFWVFHLWVCSWRAVFVVLVAVD